MNATYKLVVVQPFGSYNKGDVIYDQKIVNAILDVNHEMHVNDHHCRRVVLQPNELASVSLSSESV